VEPARDGILVLNKPAGPTSHDCVARVRRALGIRRAGHAGTLDPLATGVLIVGVEAGTRALEYLQGLPKIYRAGMVLGVVTETQDVTGAPVFQGDASGVTREALEAALRKMTGTILQVPPMVSALKVGGKKLYELARRGECVDREARRVTVYDLELLSFAPGPRARAEFRVRCSAGTYVRTLCHDMGAALGVGGALAALEREAVGCFRVEEALRLEDLEPGVPLLPLAQALEHLPRLDVDAGAAHRLGQGQFIPTAPETPDGPMRVLDPDGRLVAVAVAHGHHQNRLLAPQKVFAAAAPREAGVGGARDTAVPGGGPACGA